MKKDKTVTEKCSKNGINLDYYLNVYDLMMIDLPRPRLKRTVIATPEEWLPIIGVECEELE